MPSPRPSPGRSGPVAVGWQPTRRGRGPTRRAASARRRRGSRSSAARRGPPRSRRWPGRARRLGSGSPPACRSGSSRPGRDGGDGCGAHGRRPCAQPLPPRSHPLARRAARVRAAMGARRQRRRRDCIRMQRLACSRRRLWARSCRSGPTPTTRPTSRPGIMAAAARPRAAGGLRVGHRRRARHRTIRPLAARTARRRAPLGGGRRHGRPRRRRAPVRSACPTAASRTTTSGDRLGRCACSTRSQPDTILTFGARRHHATTPTTSPCTAGSPRRGASAGRPGRLLYATPTVEHLARFAALYEEWGIYMSDERPTGVPADELAVHVRSTGRRSTAS